MNSTEKRIRGFLSADIGKGDITSDLLFKDESGMAEIIAKEDCTVAGIIYAGKVFEILGAKVKALVQDGENVRKGTIVMKISGAVRSILSGERTALNILGRMSGIATATRRLVEKCSKEKPDIQIAGTRKTTPGFGGFEKEAIRIGGGYPHRYGLYDAILIKDNHLAALRTAYGIDRIDAIRDALRRTAGAHVKGKKIEIEVTSLEEAEEAAKLSPDEILLDNLSPAQARKAFEIIKKINPEILVEVSGGITEKNISEYAFADRISLGALTHSVKSMDFSLEIIEAWG